MIKTLRAAISKILNQVDRRDLMAAAGLAMLCWGGEKLHPGAGVTAAGAVLVAIAVLVR